ncbi:MAG TPA: class I mannose-6-phosphate isomerase [bacterium]|nr:class I mannose-6-phosphate isomerase [bacterium]
MSFMTRPFPFEDMTAVNRPRLSSSVTRSLVVGAEDVCWFVADRILASAAGHPRHACAVAMDGYVGAQWAESLDLIEAILGTRGVPVRRVDIRQYYEPPEHIERMVSPSLPVDHAKDPVSLFGRLHEGDITDFLDRERLGALIRDLTAKGKAPGGRDVTIVYGHGAASAPLIDLYDMVLYYDVTPMHAILRAREGQVKNFGDTAARALGYVLRRMYYVDFEVAVRERARLLDRGAVQYYIDNNGDQLKLVPRESLEEIFRSLVTYPLRCKPVYLEGVWGGHFFQRLRNLPGQMKNCAWVFDLIPNEVSLLIEVGHAHLEVPFTTFCRRNGVALMGGACVEKFNGVFPIRFNYDDTYHSSGNMSVQVHPPRDYARVHFNERVQQDESYYVVATGHEAKTYLGWKQDADVAKFFDQATRSTVSLTPVDYESSLNSIPSRPGDQFLIPAGTIHASGRNQVVLEIGSVTVGSYTFKMYDYVRLDLEGHLRPIHLWHGQNVVNADRRADWAAREGRPAPRLLRAGPGWAEYVIGEYDTVYFSLRRLEFDTEIEDDTAGKFHVLVLVDGERVDVRSQTDPERHFEQKFLDVVLVPACFGRYVIRNLGEGPARVHKTLLR